MALTAEDNELEEELLRLTDPFLPKTKSEIQRPIAPSPDTTPMSSTSDVTKSLSEVRGMWVEEKKDDRYLFVMMVFV